MTVRDIYVNFLFSKGFFVGSDTNEEFPFETLASLANLFNIQIISGHELVSADMISVASGNLGENVPEPFYRGFPQTVRNLTPDLLLFDQLLHYFITYRFAFFREPGHAVWEEKFERTFFRENAPIKPYAILTEEEAEARLREYVDALLDSTRPLSDAQYQLVRGYTEDYSYRLTSCACKDTAVRFLLDTENPDFATLLSLSDVIRLVEQLQYQKYGSKDIRHLNLRNQDRRFLTKVLDTIFQSGKCDVRNCFEKKRLWKGLLHHIHYKPVNKEAEAFVSSIRGDKNISAYSSFEALINKGDIKGAVDTLARYKGNTAILRNMNYLLSRCRTEEDVAVVMAHSISKNKIVLIQQLLQYSHYRNEGEKRVFKFPKFNKLRIHKESSEEVGKRKSRISGLMIELVCAQLRLSLADACKGTLGKVYVDEAMKYIALPLQETTSMGGVGTLPKGTRIPLADGKKIRAFTYWERVNDIDLSMIGLSEDSIQSEFSWRYMYNLQSSAITFSGDQTRGYDGGSEYFDIVLPDFKKMYPHIRYLICCNNVFSAQTFQECFCKAGYMLRDEADSGEVFEPKTVASSFQITCDSQFAYLFGIDLFSNEIVWLNIARDSQCNVAGASDLDFLLDYLDTVNVINLHDFAVMLATEVVDCPEDADVIFSDRILSLPENAQQIRSCDFEKVLSLMN